MNRVLENLRQQPELPIPLHLNVHLGRGEVSVPDAPDFLGYAVEARNPNDTQPSFSVRIDQNGHLLVESGPTNRRPDEDVRTRLGALLKSRIYRFWAERFNIGTSNFGSNAVLTPNATNLPEVLNVLDVNPARFERLNGLLREVLPQVRHVSVKPIGSNQVQILVWPLDYSSEKDYLAIPLNQCGSGVAQVLAILYVVMTSEQPQTIIVDEPQSFLHPGAVRKLIEVLKRYTQHQYIFATHSPTIIAATEPAPVTIARWVGTETVLEAIDPQNSKDLQLYLTEIGARLSDVFGADDILWVEGKTEEECFPKIIRKILTKSLMGTVVVGVQQTGDFSARDRRRVLELYLKLSQAKTLMPPAVAFVFDSECMSDREKQDLKRMQPGLIKFLPRRMYENYLLNVPAITAIANSIENFRPEQVREEEVLKLLEAKRADRRFYCQPEIPSHWNRHIDGARILREIFSELSENRVWYDKVVHSARITDWILENNPEELRELADFLEPILARS